MSSSAEEIAEFRQEALELLDSAEESLMALSQKTGDFKQAYDSTFRAFHSLKGAAGMMELTDIQSEAHRLESLFIAFKEQSDIPASQISLFLAGIDNMRLLLDGKNPTQQKPIVSNKSMHAEEVLREFTDECAEQLGRLSKNLELTGTSSSPSKIDEIYRDIHSIKGSAFLLSFGQIGSLAHAMESSLEESRNRQITPPGDHLDALLKAVGILEDGLKSILTQGNDLSLTEIVTAFSRKLNEFNGPLPSQATESQSTVIAPPSAPKTASPAVSAEIEQTASIRVPVPLLDNLMALMGEMVLVRNQVLQFSNSSENQTLLSMSKRLNVVTNEIQAEMMKTRMQPIGNVISKFSRVVRDISQELGKDIRLQLTGTETELDKSLLETVKDPLTHIVRNSCDHGIEPPDARRVAKKQPFGTISIKAYHEGGQVVVDISDDGRGLNREKLLSKAIENGLINSTGAAKMTDKEVFNLIFAPGLSTAAQVTNISGRGVGMDVVRTNIEKLGGTVDVSSVQGHGTSIKLKIPLTLAIVPALVVRCGEIQFAIPQVKLEELLRVENSDTGHRIELMHGVPVFRLRGNILPLVDMNSVLNLQESSPSYKNRIVNIAVLNSDRASFGVIIDEVRDTADIVVKPLNRLLKSLQIYSGATILGDGSVALIFDVMGISKVTQVGQTKLLDGPEVTKKEAETDRAATREYLLIEVNSRTQHALPLEVVHRLEDVDSARIEMSGFQRVIRYGERILPIIDVDATIGYESRSDQRPVIPVVVVKYEDQMYGLEVRKILDTLSTKTKATPIETNAPGLAANLNLAEGLVVVIDPLSLIRSMAGNARQGSSGRVVASEKTV